MRCLHLLKQAKKLFHIQVMAKSKFEYVKDFEIEDKILPNCWIVIRLDGRAFHKFSTKHQFQKPNDERALHLMNKAAMMVMQEFKDVVLAYGQSDEYSFVVRKDTTLYNRRGSKIMTYINSFFSSSYVYFWKYYFKETKLKNPPAFDARIVLYPSDQNLRDYLSWRQADCHVNNLYNTTFWALVLKGGLTNTQAEKRLCGTLSAEKNEILFSQFNTNYNNEAIMYRKGTTLVRKKMTNPLNGQNRAIILPLHEDMINEKFWEENTEILKRESLKQYEWPPDVELPSLVLEQLTHAKEEKKPV